MAVTLEHPVVDGLDAVVDALRGWQYDGAPMQLHPGDVGWQWRFGAAATAAVVRTWRRREEILAVGLVDDPGPGDSPGLMRLAIAPPAQSDEDLAQQILHDVSRPERGVLPLGSASIEARCGALFPGLLRADGWVADEPWTPLQRDLAEPVKDCGLHIEVVGPDRVSARTAVQRAAFENSVFTDDRWYAMAAGPAYADAQCLVGYDDDGTAVAAVTVWSAGVGRPGLLEPMGVHRDHRGHGYGTAISVAAAAALQQLGSSTATVCTPSANVVGVATYVSAGFRELPQARDLHRSA